MAKTENIINTLIRISFGFIKYKNKLLWPQKGRLSPACPVTLVYSPQSLSTVVTWDSFRWCLFLVLLISLLLFNFDCVFAERWPQPSQIDPSHSLILPLASGFHTAWSLPWASPCHPTPFRINTLYPIGQCQRMLWSMYIYTTFRRMGLQWR